jgi:hypothetical protein
VAVTASATHAGFGDPYVAVIMVTVSGFGLGIGTVSDHFTSVSYLPAGNGGGPVERHAGLVAVTVPPGWALAGGFRLAFIIAVSCVAVAVVVTTVLVRSRVETTATSVELAAEVIESDQAAPIVAYEGENLRQPEGELAAAGTSAPE